MPGYIRKRGEHSYQIIYDAPRTANNKRNQKRETVHGTKRDAQNRLTKLLSEINAGTYVAPTDLTVEEYFVDRWLPEYAKPKLSHKTYERYEGIVRLNIVPKIGRTKLKDVTPLQLQTYENELLKSGRADGNGGLSPRTVIQIHRILHRGFVQAIGWELLARNPADGVSLPHAERRVTKILTREESLRLLETARNTQYYYAPVVLCLATGMRRGEILALNWDDIDMDSCRLSVNKSLEDTEEYGICVNTHTKTYSSIRMIRLPKWAIMELRWWRSQQLQNKLLLGEEKYQDNNLVCSRPDGSYINPDTFSSVFRYVVKKAKLSIRFHDIRHSQATLLIAAGIPVKVVSERLGHSTTRITQDIYTHVLPDMQEAAADEIDRYFNPTKKEENQETA